MISNCQVTRSKKPMKLNAKETNGVLLTTQHTFFVIFFSFFDLRFIFRALCVTCYHAKYRDSSRSLAWVWMNLLRGYTASPISMSKVRSASAAPSRPPPFSPRQEHPDQNRQDRRGKQPEMGGKRGVKKWGKSTCSEVRLLSRCSSDGTRAGNRRACPAKRAGPRAEIRYPGNAGGRA